MGDQDHHKTPGLQHQFDNMDQQFSSGKLGIWIFLVTEILLFSGLFCAYAVYRASHPEIFIYAHKYLDTTLGAVNTAVLIFSSFTMAWAVRSAQRGAQRALVILLTITLACGVVFLGIKYVEYEHKWKSGLLWGERFDPIEHGAGHEKSSENDNSSSQGDTAKSGKQDTAAGTAQDTVGDTTETTEQDTMGDTAHAPATEETSPTEKEDRPPNVHIFFGVYFLMTGLHGLHVIAGMVTIGWMIFRARRGDFSPEYFGPVDYTGLYWHLVDLIWIYLFPLLYLIG